MGSDSQDIQQHLGCGTEMNLSQITLNINTTTGGCFSVIVDSQTSVENLKKIVAKKLKVAKDRICLLHREKELHDGSSLKENGIIDGSKIILLPNVETGLLAQRPENTVMQALESLNDSQVNDFLSGKTPLNLSMRLGDHMMLIQLQLSTVNPTTNSSASTSASSSAINSNGQSRTTRNVIRSRTSTSRSTATMASSSQPSTSTNSTPIKNNDNYTFNSSPEQTPIKYQKQEPSTSRTAQNNRNQSQLQQQGPVGSPLEQQRDLLLSTEEFENLRSIVNSLTNIQNDTDDINNEHGEKDIEMNTSNYSNSNDNDSLLEQSPIKSLSNLVSSPIKTIPLKHIPISTTPRMSSAAQSHDISNSCTDPISAKLTSCLCKRLDTNNTTSNGCDTNCQFSRGQQQLNANRYNEHNTPSTSMRSSTSLLHRTLNNPIAKTKSNGVQHSSHHHHHHHHQHNHHNHSHHHHSHHHRHSGCTQPNLRRSKSSDNICVTEQGIGKPLIGTTITNETSVAVDQPINIIDTTAGSSIIEANNPDTLAEASRNLTKTLRKLSKEVFTNKVDVSTLPAATDDVNSVRSRANGSNANNSGNSSGSSNQVASTSSAGTVAGIGSGAVIESMRNHGRGIYSGTFSGTLNPALQDRYGRPKRDISTVIHILNDLLSATPHYSRGARISFEPAHNSRSSKYSSSKRSSISSSHSHHHRDQCSKCITSISSKTCSYAGCTGTHHHSSDKSIACRRTNCTSRHSHTNEMTSMTKNTSMPSNLTAANTPIDCHQCQMRLVNSAPVTPTTSSPVQLINFNESFDVDSGNVSMNSSFNTNNSSNNSIISPFVCGISSSITSTPSPVSNPICTKCSNMEIENSKTKTKLDQLRLVMQQRRERREARKMKTAPYGARIIGTASAAPTSAGSTNATDTTTNGTVIETIDGPPTNPIVEQVNTLA